MQTYVSEPRGLNIWWSEVGDLQEEESLTVLRFAKQKQETSVMNIKREAKEAEIEYNIAIIANMSEVS